MYLRTYNSGIPLWFFLFATYCPSFCTMVVIVNFFTTPLIFITKSFGWLGHSLDSMDDDVLEVLMVFHWIVWCSNSLLDGCTWGPIDPLVEHPSILGLSWYCSGLIMAFGIFPRRLHTSELPRHWSQCPRHLKALLHATSHLTHLTALVTHFDEVVFLLEELVGHLMTWHKGSRHILTYSYLDPLVMRYLSTSAILGNMVLICWGIVLD